jgi:hypothetical protein
MEYTDVTSMGCQCPNLQEELRVVWSTMSSNRAAMMAKQYNRHIKVGVVMHKEAKLEESIAWSRW